MPRDKADFAWYSAESRKQKLSPRCPIACAELCPRYFRSLAVLGMKGGAGHVPITEIPKERFASLDRKWKPFEPVVLEDAPSTTWFGDERAYISHLCPEVAYDIFGYFASDLYHYADEIDYEQDLEGYKRDGIIDQFESRWQNVTPRHYTECREYSIHADFAAVKSSKAVRQRGEVSPKTRWKVLARDSFTCTYCGRKPPEVALHVDHKVSVKDGGLEELDNLVTACDKCNSGKGDLSL